MWAYFSNLKWHLGLYLPFIFFPENLSVKHNHIFVPVLGGKPSMAQLYVAICKQNCLILTGVSHCWSFVISIDTWWTEAICSNLANKSCHQEKNRVHYISILSHTLFVRFLYKRKTTFSSFLVFHEIQSHTSIHLILMNNNFRHSWCSKNFARRKSKSELKTESLEGCS